MEIIEFGNAILRKVSKQVKLSEIASEKIQKLIQDLIQACDEHPMGVGIAAPQIGINLRLFVIRTKPTEGRPNLKSRTRICINPVILEFKGSKTLLWDGCLSEGKEPMFAQTERYTKLKVQYLNQDGKLENENLDGFLAHVFQHELDHLDGILFPDRVMNSKSWMSKKEYIKIRKTSK
ncbi:MAG: peptide deformylase [Candidatus Saccharimonadales bacterium]